MASSASVLSDLQKSAAMKNKIRFIKSAVATMGLLAGMLGMMSPAQADSGSSNPLQNADGQMIFHCTSGGPEHPVAETCSGGVILLDRTPLSLYTCGQCVTDMDALTGAYNAVGVPGRTHYNVDNNGEPVGSGGRFSFNGKAYYNGEADLRVNAVFCDFWFGASPGGAGASRSCSCATELTPDENHGRCRPRVAGDCEMYEEFIDAQGGGGTCRDRVAGDCETHQEFVERQEGGGTCRDRVAGDCETYEEFVERQEGGGTCRDRVAGDCETHEEFVEREEGGGTCRDRVEGDCEMDEEFIDAQGGGGICLVQDASGCSAHEEFVERQEGGGTCRNRVAGDCETHEEFVDAQGGGGTCRDRVASDCADNYEFAAADESGGSCLQCPMGGTSTGGAECACPEGQTEFGRGTDIVTDDFCAVGISCTGGTPSHSNSICICDEPSHRAFGNVCAAEVSCTGGNVSEDNICICTNTALQWFNGVCERPLDEASCQGENQNFDAMNNRCMCAAGYESDGGSNSLRCVAACDADEERVNGECVTACGANEERRGASCVCESGYENVGGSLLAPRCMAVCDADEERISGSCIDQCAPNETRNPTTRVCECSGAFEQLEGSCIRACADGQIRVNGICIRRVACVDGTVTSENECQCSSGHENVRGACQPACGMNEERNPSTGICRCEAGYEDLDSGAETDCQLECVAPEMRQADGSCAVPPPAATGDGGNDDAAIALVAVPAALLGGYALLGGLGYIDPAYDFNYSGENENLEWNATGGFNLQHGGLRSYASATQTGEEISYASGISYEKDFFALTYDARESGSEYLYDFGASLKADFGLWVVAPTVAADLEYQRDEGEWNQNSAAGLAATWTAHRWNVKAQSNFTGAAQHALDLELKF